MQTYPTTYDAPLMVSVTYAGTQDMPIPAGKTHARIAYIGADQAGVTTTVDIGGTNVLVFASTAGVRGSGASDVFELGTENHIGVTIGGGTNPEVTVVVAFW